MASGIVEPSSQQNSESQSGQAQAPRGERSKLVQRLLDAGPNLPAFLNDLLTTQAVTVAGTEAAGFIIERAQDGLALKPVAHIRPDDSDAQTRSAAVQAFVEIVKPCVTQGKDGAIEVGGGSDIVEPQFCLVTLLRADAEVVAVSAVIARCRNLELARQRLMSMQLVAGYFELWTLKRNSEQSKMIAMSHQHVLQLATAVATAEGFSSAAMNLCNELATRTSATRVAVGWLKGRNIKVKALSHTEDFDKKQELILQIEKAMEECADQEQAVQYVPSGEGSTDNVTRAAAELSKAQGGNVVLSLPLRRHAEIVGVVSLEFAPGSQLGAEVAQGLAVAVELLAPQLYDRFQNDRYLVTKVGQSAKYTLEEALGPKYWIAKLIAIGSVIGLAIIFNLIPFVDTRLMYRVTAPFTFEALNKRSLSAPFDGFIAEVMVKPGQKVKAGDPLVRLDTTELQDKLYEAQSQALGHQREAEKYRPDSSKQPDYLIALAQRDQAMALVNLYSYQIKQATLISPADAEILKGDLEDKKGAPVKQGDVLFEVADLTSLRVAMNVNEADIQDIKEPYVDADGKTIVQNGKFATTSLPTSKFPFEVERIVPLGQAKEGSNVFTVYGKLPPGDKNAWLPGMAGEARVDVQKKNMALDLDAPVD